MASHQGNANWNYTEIPSHSNQDDIIKNNKDNKRWWECRGEAHLHTASAYVSQLQALWESIWSFFESLKPSKSTLWFISSTPGYLLERLLSQCATRNLHMFGVGGPSVFALLSLINKATVLGL